MIEKAFPPGKKRIAAIPFLAVWCFVVLVFSFKTYSDYFYAYEAVRFVPCLVLSTIQWTGWAGLYLALARASRLLYGRKGTWFRFLIGQACLGFSISVLMYFFTFATMQIFVSAGWLPKLPFTQFLFLFNCLIYVAIVAVENAIFFVHNALELERQKSQLEAQLTQAQLQTLKMTLRPHFLFNALNTVAMLIEVDTKKAARVTAMLGSFLRATLAITDQNEITLSQELDLVRKYLNIEQLRFENRIQVVYDIDPQTLEASVPNLILQPIVENAMTHGFGASTKSGILRITTTCDQQRLLLEIRDSGSGIPKGECEERIGLGSTRSRIDKMYGSNGELTISGSPDRGTTVKLVIPLEFGH